MSLCRCEEARASGAGRDLRAAAEAPARAAARRRRSSCSCRRRCCSSPSSSSCRWAKPAGTASSTGTATARRRSSSACATSQLCSPTRRSARALDNNLLIIVVSLAVQLPLALGDGGAARRPRCAARPRFRLIFFLPYILADVAAGLIWRFVYDGDYGLVSPRSRRDLRRRRRPIVLADPRPRHVRRSWS